MTVHEQNLAWIDLEMTGLDTQNDVILEIATIVTDAHLNILAEGPVFAIYQPDSMLDAMDKWNQRQHAKTGLVERVRASQVTLEEAQQKTLHFLRQYIVEKKSPMSGNSICQDRRFLARQMPALEAFFHYRNLDVSTVKELAMRWHPELVKAVKKKSEHTALADIKDSIAELAYYREHFFAFSKSTK